MKFRIDRHGFSDAVSGVARRLPSRPAVPILAGVKLSADGNMLVVSGFDYETSTTVHAQADVMDAGSVLVSGKLLADIAKVLPQKPVEVTAEGSSVRIVCGSAKFSLPTMSVDEYPTLPAMPATTGSLPVEVFAEAIGQVAAAAGKDDSLPMLTGIKTHTVDGSLFMAATDRFRLAVKRVADWDAEVDVLLPAKTLSDVARTLPSGLETVAFGATDSLWGVDTGATWTTMRTLDVEFPQYRRLIPTSHAAVASVDVSELAGAIKRVALVAERGAQIRMAFEDGRVTLSSGGDDAGSAEETLPADVVGDRIVIGFNPGYLMDGLSTIHTSRVLFGFVDGNKPATLRPHEGDVTQFEGSGPFTAPDTDFVYLLMPVRLANN